MAEQDIYHSLATRMSQGPFQQTYTGMTLAKAAPTVAPTGYESTGVGIGNIALAFIEGVRRGKVEKFIRDQAEEEAKINRYMQAWNAAYQKAVSEGNREQINQLFDKYASFMGAIGGEAAKEAQRGAAAGGNKQAGSVAKLMGSIFEGLTGGKMPKGKKHLNIDQDIKEITSIMQQPSYTQLAEQVKKDIIKQAESIPATEYKEEAVSKLAGLSDLLRKYTSKEDADTFLNSVLSRFETPEQRMRKQQVELIIGGRGPSSAAHAAKTAATTAPPPYAPAAAPPEPTGAPAPTPRPEQRNRALETLTFGEPKALYLIDPEDRSRSVAAERDPVTGNLLYYGTNRPIPSHMLNWDVSPTPRHATGATKVIQGVVGGKLGTFAVSPEGKVKELTVDGKPIQPVPKPTHQYAPSAAMAKLQKEEEIQRAVSKVINDVEKAFADNRYGRLPTGDDYINAVKKGYYNSDPTVSKHISDVMTRLAQLKNIMNKSGAKGTPGDYIQAAVQLANTNRQSISKSAGKEDKAISAEQRAAELEKELNLFEDQGVDPYVESNQ